MQTPAKEMLAQVAQDLKARGLTHERVARDLNYKMRQSVGTILSSRKYMTPAQAKRFHEAYGYYEPFLTIGEGSLSGPVTEEDCETTFLLPQYVLLLRPVENYDEFQKAYEVLIRGMVASYGAQNIQRFLNDTIRYVSLLDNPEKEWARAQMFDNKGDVHAPHDTKIAKQDPDFIQQIDAARDIIKRGLYNIYNDMVTAWNGYQNQET